MKISKGILFVVVLSFLLGAAVMSFAKPPLTWKILWPKQKGAICLNVYFPNGSVCLTCNQVGRVNMYVTNMGDGHYLVTGRNTEMDEDGNVTEINPFIGEAELVDGNVKIHITSSGIKPPVPAEGPDALGDPGDVHGNMTTIILNPVTLIGTAETLDLMSYKDNSDYKVQYAGELYLEPCD